MSRAVATCSCPAGDRCAAAAARSAASPASVRNAPSPSRGAPWWKKTAKLRPGGVLGPAGRDRSPAAPGTPGSALAGSSTRAGPGQQHSQMPGVGLVGLGMPLAAASRSSVGWFPDMRGDPGRGQFLGDIPPPGAPLHRERDVVTAGEPRQPGPQVLPVSRGDLAAPDLPGHGAGDSRTSAASGGYPARLRWTSGPPQAPEGAQPPARELHTKPIVTRLS